jgi:hypothetical protein
MGLVAWGSAPRARPVYEVAEGGEATMKSKRGEREGGRLQGQRQWRKVRLFLCYGSEELSPIKRERGKSIE